MTSPLDNALALGTGGRSQTKSGLDAALELASVPAAQKKSGLDAALEIGSTPEPEGMGFLEAVDTAISAVDAPIYGAAEAALSGKGLKDIGRAAVENVGTRESRRATPTSVLKKHVNPLVEKAFKTTEKAGIPILSDILGIPMPELPGGSEERFAGMIGAAPKVAPSRNTLADVDAAILNTGLAMVGEFAGRPSSYLLPFGKLFGLGAKAAKGAVGAGVRAVEKIPAGAKAVAGARGAGQAVAEQFSTKARYGEDITARLREMRGLSEHEQRQFLRDLAELKESHPLKPAEWGDVTRAHELTPGPAPENLSDFRRISEASEALGKRVSDPIHKALQEAELPTRELAAGERHVPHVLQSELLTKAEQEAMGTRRMKSPAGEIRGAKSLWKRKHDVPIDKAHEAGYDFTLQPLEAWGQRGPGVIRAKESARFIHDMAARPGSQAVKIKSVKELPEGHKILDVRFQGKDGEAYQYAFKPDSLEYRVIKDQITDPLSPRAGVMKVLGPAMDWWKLHAIGTFGFGLRNAVGNYALMYYGAGPRIFKGDNFKRAYGVLKGTGGDITVGGKTYTREQLERLMAAQDVRKGMQAQGLAVEGKAGGAKPLFGSRKLQAVNPLSTENVYLQKTRKLAGGIEDHSRIMMFLDGLDQGMDTRAAGKHMREHLFDYSDLTPTERKIKEAVPFYGWVKNNVPLQIKTILKNPQRFIAPYRVAGAIEGQVSEEERRKEKGEWSRFRRQRGDRMLPIRGAGGKHYSLRLDLPQQDVNVLDMLTSGRPVSESVRDTVVSRVHPFLKFPLVEAPFNVSTHTGEKIDWGADVDAPGYLDFLTRTLGLGNVMPGVYNVGGKTKMDPRAKFAASNLVPELGFLERLTKPGGASNAISQFAAREAGTKIYPPTTKEEAARNKKYQKKETKQKRKEERRKLKRLPF